MEIFLKYFMNNMYLLPLNLCQELEVSRALRLVKKYGNISEIFDEIFQNKKYRIFHITNHGTPTLPWYTIKVPDKVPWYTMVMPW